ncbi:hypothetical protein GI374_17610 [Paracoccus sp. S-4012]|uniref:Stf0 family sulfotransferase n=1 Tax=Paracoccus sp. S-4012 TaxID=2665648 RepID=UPI0012AF0604|nr:Stf0 family sulfotransferase [Paracoccus sp. S-4012]MRX52182.1 hypothetical protein [Paracoccus sp. S-4012]
MSSVVDELAEPQIHEVKISDFYGGDVFFAQEEPIFQQPIALLLFANRSGSNLLAEHLLASGRFSGLQETLNYENVEDVSRRHGVKSFPQYVRAIAAHNMRHGIFGTKCSLGQLAMLLRWNILSMFSGAKIINIERRDVVSQAVSMSIASQTESWSSDVPPTGDPVYRFDEIEKYFTHFTGDVIKRRILIDLLEIDARTFEYDEVVSKPFEVVSECCGLFGVPVPEGVPERTRLKKQGGALNQEYSARFRQDLRRRLLHRT